MGLGLFRLDPAPERSTRLVPRQALPGRHGRLCHRSPTLTGCPVRAETAWALSSPGPTTLGPLSPSFLFAYLVDLIDSSHWTSNEGIPGGNRYLYMTARTKSGSTPIRVRDDPKAHRLRAGVLAPRAEWPE